MQLMKKQFLFLFIFLAPVLHALGQLRLPQVSPQAVIQQTIGLTDIKIIYHTPGVKGREIWGKLVPYGQVWRCGANEATLISFTDNVKINGEPLLAGTYSLFTLPESAGKWQVIFNRDTTLWGSEKYDAAKDALRVPMQSQATSFHETLQYAFSDIQPKSGKLNLAWEKLSLSFNIAVEPFAKALSYLKADLAQVKPDDWSAYAQASEYLVQNNTEHELALSWINKSLTIKDTFYNNWVKAQLLAQKEEYLEAINLTKKAIKLGQSDPANFSPLAALMERSVEEWRVKSLARS
ncbi:MAG: hypothetical protein COW65_07225 [Cytophagales bacterium CG18_big_fil_WC_8_21_14_2_50_42_9]|nr:MAG: hypothetical protein COW65_07225 [Cytophagales bacterium CG18_big_fil_WC_8_21_14_2_50_42_9]